MPHTAAAEWVRWQRQARQDVRRNSVVRVWGRYGIPRLLLACTPKPWHRSAAGARGRTWELVCAVSALRAFFARGLVNWVHDASGGDADQSATSSCWWLRYPDLTKLVPIRATCARSRPLATNVCLSDARDVGPDGQEARVQTYAEGIFVKNPSRSGVVGWDRRRGKIVKQ